MKIHVLWSLVAIALASGGCKDKKKPDESTKEILEPSGKAEPDIPPRPVAPVALDPAKIVWKSRTFEKAKLTFDALDSVKTHDSMMGLASYVRQHSEPVTLTIWAGPGRTMEKWREGVKTRKGLELGEPKKVKVCGGDGVMQELHIAGRKLPAPSQRVMPLGIEAATGKKPAGTGKSPGDNAPVAKQPPAKVAFRTVPARTGIVLGFKSGDTPVIASWTIVTDKREAFKKAEEHFFASIKCNK